MSKSSPDSTDFNPEADSIEDATVIIDRRPMALVLLRKFRPQLILITMLLCFLHAVGSSGPEGLSPEGWKAVCVFALAVALWVSALIPLAITGLMAIALIPMLEILDAPTTYSYFGSNAVFFILGAFTLGAAVVGCGLSARMTTSALKRFGTSPTGLVRGVYFFTAAASCLISEHAVAAMSFPVVWELARSFQSPGKENRVGKGLFFAMAWGCIVGGTTTILGGGRAPLAIGILEETTGHTIGFVEYMLLDLPLVVILLGVGWILLHTMLKGATDSMTAAMEILERRIRDQGKTTLREKLVGLALLATVGFWVTFGEELGLANIAILSTSALFIFGLVSWQDIEENVNWGIILMYGGAITLGSALAATGAAQWMTELMVGDWQGSPELLMMTIGVLSVVLTEFMSNSAVIAILMPPALSLATSHGIDPRLMTMAVVLPSNFAFMLPMATPATAMAYSSGTFSPAEAIRRGAIMDLAGVVLLAALIYVYWPTAQALLATYGG